MKKIAIIGASYLQNPLILKAKEMGIETHVFAWKSGDVGEVTADFFYPISITEKDEILNKCKEIEIDGICTIASDLAVITVNYVADKLGLVGNSMYCTEVSTNKHLMRKQFEKNGNPSPKSRVVFSAQELYGEELEFPLIVKPTDRSGSRGITKVNYKTELEAAIDRAKEQSFEKKALVEEFAHGDEYSVECISYKGKHYYLTTTKKFTTGAPMFIETGHCEPAGLELEVEEEVKKVVFSALDSLKIENGASHSEIKIDENGIIRIIEIGGRMGGDFIGSDLVHCSTGIDFVKNVILLAMGEQPDLTPDEKMAVGVRFILSKEDLEVLDEIKKNSPEMLVREDGIREVEGDVVDSSSRFGAFLIKAKKYEDILKYMPLLQKNSIHMK